jgi:hypothetical protein
MGMTSSVLSFEEGGAKKGLYFKVGTGRITSMPAALRAN